MPTATLYGFITDDALKLTTKVDLNSSSDQGYGILSGECGAYFVKRATLGDTRRNRLSLLESRAPKGSMAFIFDQNHADTEMLSKMTDQESQLLFNVLERIYYQQEYTDSDLEVQLSGATYTGYVPGSLNHATEVGNATATNIDGVTKVVEFRDWYSFEFNYGNIHLIIHAWIKKEAFAKNYPYTTITAVVPPYEPDILINPAVLLASANLNVLTNSANFVFNQSDIEVATRDQNGIYVYVTKYIVDSSRTYQLPFALAYCGPNEPSGLECRDAIKDYLKSNTDITDEELDVLFPELYVNSRFYIVPLWDVYSQTSEAEIYNSIWSANTLMGKAEKIFENQEAKFLNEHLEFMTNAQNKMMLMTLPDPLNQDNFSILALHPTYQDYSSQVPGFKYMTAATQEFASTLNRCLAVLTGSSTSNEFTAVKDGVFNYLTFTSGIAEYYVMDRTSYNTYIQEI